MREPDNTKTFHLAIGTLLEAAIRDQKAIREAAQGLRETEKTVRESIHRIPGQVAREVDASLQRAIDTVANQLMARFEEANANAELASAAYQASAKFSFWRLVLPVLGLTAFGATAIFLAAWMIMPSTSEIQEKRAEVDRLEQRLSSLEQQGARADYTQCIVSERPKRLRLCVKLDTGINGTWGEYRIVANK